MECLENLYNPDGHQHAADHEQHRAAGDWGGPRQQMMDKGLRLDISLTQILQGVLSGGVTEKLRYQGGLDLVFQLDTGKADLWPGGLLKI